AIGIGIAHGGIGVAAVGEACSEDVAGADPFAVNLLFLVQDFKAVALPDFLGEVHVITEDVGHLHGQVVGQSCILCCDKQGDVDGATGKFLGQFRLNDI